ncbi:MAG: Ribose ABC transport system, permease protein RbsC, partial [uncultured Phycisphaerae bacterium]
AHDDPVDPVRRHRGARGDPAGEPPAGDAGGTVGVRRPPRGDRVLPPRAAVRPGVVVAGQPLEPVREHAPAARASPRPDDCADHGRHRFVDGGRRRAVQRVGGVGDDGHAAPRAARRAPGGRGGRHGGHGRGRGGRRAAERAGRHAAAGAAVHRHAGDDDGGRRGGRVGGDGGEAGGRRPGRRGRRRRRPPHDGHLGRPEHRQPARTVRRHRVRHGLRAADRAVGGRGGRNRGPRDARPHLTGSPAVRGRAERAGGGRLRRAGAGDRGRRVRPQRLVRGSGGRPVHRPAGDRQAGPARPRRPARRDRGGRDRRHQPVRRQGQGALDRVRRAAVHPDQQQPEPARPAGRQDHGRQGVRDPGGRRAGHAAQPPDGAGV